MIDIWTDNIADAFRWWAAPGALLGILLLVPRLAHIAVGLFNGDAVDDTIMPPIARFTALFCGLLFMLATLVAGVIIPLATDQRLALFNGDTPLFRQLMTLSWLTWGWGSWGIAISLSPRWRMMTLSCLVMGFIALWLSLTTHGAML